MSSIKTFANRLFKAGSSNSSSAHIKESNANSTQAAKHDISSARQGHAAQSSDSRARWKIDAQFRSARSKAPQSTADNHVRKDDYLELLNDPAYFAFTPRPAIFRSLAQGDSLAARITAEADEENAQRLTSKKALSEQLTQVQEELEARCELTPHARNARMVKLAKAVSAACKTHNVSLTAPGLALLRTIGSDRIQGTRIPPEGFSNEALACAKSIDRELKLMQARLAELQRITEITEEDDEEISFNAAPSLHDNIFSRTQSKLMQAKLSGRQTITEDIKEESSSEDEWFNAPSSFHDVESDITHSQRLSFYSTKSNDSLVIDLDTKMLNEEDSSILRRFNEEEIQDIADTLHAAIKDNNADGILDLAFTHLEKIPEEERLAWLLQVNGGKAMRHTVAKGLPEAIEAWGDVVRLLPKRSRFAFLDKRDEDNGLDSIAASIFSNTELGAMKAWGSLLESIPDRSQERSELLFARLDHDAGKPALALLFERGEKQALDQFVELAKKHVWYGNEEIHHVLLECMPTLKILTSSRGKVSGREAQDWVQVNGLKYANPQSLFGIAEETAKAYGKLVQLVPKKYRNDVLFPEDIWTVSRLVGREEGIHRYLSKELDPHQVQELAQSFILLKAMVRTIIDEERKGIAKAHGKLEKLIPKKFRNTALPKKGIATTPDAHREEGLHNALSDELDPHQAQELAQSITQRKAMISTIMVEERKSAEERKEIVKAYKKLEKLTSRKFWNSAFSPKNIWTASKVRREERRHIALSKELDSDQVKGLARSITDLEIIVRIMAAEERKTAEECKAIVEAYKTLEQVVPKKFRNDVLFPKDIWTAPQARREEGHHGVLSNELDPRQAQELVQATTLLNTIVPTLTDKERKEIATAYGKLWQLVPTRFQNNVLLPKNIWTAPKTRREEGHRSALCKELNPHQARELAHSITLLKAMAPTMTVEERETVLDEIRSRHATKTMGIWKNTRSYKKFKKAWPAVDAMLLDLKAELKKDKR